MGDDCMDLDAPEDGKVRHKKGQVDRRMTASIKARPKESLKPRRSVSRPKRPLPAVTVEIHSPWLFPESTPLRLHGLSSSSSIAADFECPRDYLGHGPGSWSGEEGYGDRISPSDVLIYVPPKCHRPRDSPDLIRC